MVILIYRRFMLTIVTIGLRWITMRLQVGLLLVLRVEICLSSCYSCWCTRCVIAVLVCNNNALQPVESKLSEQTPDVFLGCTCRTSLHVNVTFCSSIYSLISIIEISEYSYAPLCAPSSVYVVHDEL